jgi:prolyl-tRNA synthetase
MNFSVYYIPTLREAPSDAVIASHVLMLRAGLMRKLANGLFAYLPLGLRVFRKLEAIIREEMEAIGCLEVKPPVVIPGELWKESGRWDTMGESLLRVKNRTGADLVVSPTAEEAFTALVRDELSSYKQLPISIYQMNTKYRDEIRPRYGVMRGREFTMKDAYSFHADTDSLDKTYRDMDSAYRKIFARAGLSVIAVRADSGAMGGSGSQEFMVESAVGDNTLLICPKCDYAANVEKATCKDESYSIPHVGGSLPPRSEAAQKNAPSTLPPSAGEHTTNPRNAPQKELIDTPSVRTIDELCAYLKVPATTFIKTLIYRVTGAENLSFVAVCIRGDLEVNETKLCSHLGAQEVALAGDADVEHITGAPVGFAGPVGLVSVTIIVDYSVRGIASAVTGANAKDKHYRNVVPGRDFTPAAEAELRTVKEGDLCPVCGAPLYEKKGNELGHIFKLGYKYSKSMKVSYLDEDGKAQIPIMGCYGIGVDRTLASVIEGSHDERGIIWHPALTPFDVHIVPIAYEGDVKAACDKIAAELGALGLDYLLDDRNERAGVKFNDADLIGLPFRLVVGGKNLAASPPMVELKPRTATEAELVPLADAARSIAEKRAALMAERG